MHQLPHALSFSPDAGGQQGATLTAARRCLVLAQVAVQISKWSSE